MDTNSEGTLITLLENKHILFDLIDHADENNGKGVEEFSVPLYKHLLTKVVAQVNRREERRLIGILSLESLEKLNLLAYWDKKADTFSFKDFVVQMFRHLESRRLKELSDAELNGLHARLQEIYEQIVSPAFNWDRELPEYKEHYAHTIQTLREISERIDQNVDSLRDQAKYLSEIADTEIDGNFERAEQVHNALKKIFDLSQRYITPTLTFLNPDLDWKSNNPPLYLVTQIMERFENRSLSLEHSLMNRIRWNLFRASERISDVQRNLDNYINLYKEQRQLHNAIEKRFNDFMSQVNGLKDRKLNGNKLDPSSAIFPELGGFGGIKTHIQSQSAILNLPKEDGSAHLDEHLRTRLQNIKDLKGNRVDGSTNDRPVDVEDIRARKRFHELVELSNSLVIIDGVDTYEQIHHHLKNSMTDYHLADILDVYTLMITNNETPVILGGRSTITHEGKVFNYFERLPRKEKIA